MNPEYHDLTGGASVALILLCCLLLHIGRIDVRGLVHSELNLLGTVC